MATKACGVDFGTSNSTVGWWRPGVSALLPLEGGKATLPSVVFFNAEEDSVSFGRAAIAEYLDGYEGRLMRSLKSILGTGLMDSQTEVHGRSLAFRDLLGHFIGELKQRAETEAGRSFDHAVFGRPVHFIDDNIEADRLAEFTLAEVARKVGFKEVSFQFEPIAAALHYEESIQKEELVLIVDIGGGTSDFSLLRLSPERHKVDDRQSDILANAGVHIGGTDLDRRLNLASVMPLLGYRSRLRNNAEIPNSYYFNLSTWHTINFVYTRRIWSELQDLSRDVVERDKFERLLKVIANRSGHELAMRIEEAKIALSSADQTELALDMAEPGLRHALTRSELDAAIDGEVMQVRDAAAGILQAAGIRAADVDTVFFTGGSSGVPHLRKTIGALLPEARAVEGDLFGSIGAGLAVEARKRYG
ncbi:Hsp70 family protein [Parachitinimonas caeni]|uniref:Hsp70 family protein n=1 Tax=Parachitinimonas caeni TaxID=3031301 RepID=A0ABT7DWI0_9NEIS|nr:Hsp70 family protein [Parachitinimonas caeni]MDK2123458.1 Hsp70 family protein [Parachitinimonas caeni]